MYAVNELTLKPTLAYRTCTYEGGIKRVRVDGQNLIWEFTNIPEARSGRTVSIKTSVRGDLNAATEFYSLYGEDLTTVLGQVCTIREECQECSIEWKESTFSVTSDQFNMWLFTQNKVTIKLDFTDNVGGDYCARRKDSPVYDEAQVILEYEARCPPPPVPRHVNTSATSKYCYAMKWDPDGNGEYQQKQLIYPITGFPQEHPMVTQPNLQCVQAGDPIPHGGTDSLPGGCSFSSDTPGKAWYAYGTGEALFSSVSDCVIFLYC